MASVTGAKPPTRDLALKQIQDEADDYAHMLTEPIVKFSIKYLRDYNYKKLGKLMLQAFRELDFPKLEKALGAAEILHNELLDASATAKASVEEVPFGRCDEDMTAKGCTQTI